HTPLSGLNSLVWCNSYAHYAKGTPSSRSKTRLRPLVSVWFQDLFTPLLGVLFTFPSRYWFTIGLLKVFSLTRWYWLIHTGFLWSRATQDTDLQKRRYKYGTITLFGRTFQIVLLNRLHSDVSPTTPCCKQHGLGCFAFARHYLRNHYCFLFLRVLRCFSSPGSHPVLRRDDDASRHQVSPFGHLRITDC